MGLDEVVLRVATLDDKAAVDALMKESARALFPRFYNEQQSASAVRYVAQVDPTGMSLDCLRAAVVDNRGSWGLAIPGSTSRR